MFRPSTTTTNHRSIRARWAGAVAAGMMLGTVSFHPAHADNIVVDWNNEFQLITQQTSGNLVAGPPEVARELAQLGAAMSDAVNAATGGTISSFAYTGGTMANANASVAAATAAYTALTNIFTDQVWSQSIASLTGSGSNTSNTALATNVIIPELNNFFSNQLSSLGLNNPATLCATDNSALCNGYNLGLAAATAVNTSSTFSPSASGATAAIINGLTANMPSGSGTTPGVYVPPSATGGRPEMFPTWGTTTPTGVTSAQVTAAISGINSPNAQGGLANYIGTTSYANQLLMTECLGSKTGQSGLSQATQTACAAAGYSVTTAQALANAKAALFWNDPGTTLQPPDHWLQIADTVLTNQGSNLLQSAQLTALLGEAENSAGIAAWTVKYANNLWRPITAITSCSDTASWNGNFTTCDPNWKSLIATPPHPDYVAGHPAFSGASATILADFFGTDNITFSSTSQAYCNGGTPSFNSANFVTGCTLNGVTYKLCGGGLTPTFDGGGLPVSCTDGTNTYAFTGAGDCNTVSTTGSDNGSPLICPITLDFSGFTDAALGSQGSEISRIYGGIHTLGAVVDANTIGMALGSIIASNAGLPDIIPEPSSFSLCAVSLLALGRIRRRTLRI